MSLLLRRFIIIRSSCPLPQVVVRMIPNSSSIHSHQRRSMMMSAVKDDEPDTEGDKGEQSEEKKKMEAARLRYVGLWSVECSFD